MDIFQTNKNQKRLVIIGGGFAGIELAKRIDTKKFEVLLLDKHNYFTFQPLLYQVATGGLEPDSVAYPLRKIFSKKKHISFRLAEVFKIDTDSKVIETNIGFIPFDILVIASGSTTNFFGMDQLQKNALSLKSVTDALDLRSFILQNFEAALLTTDINLQKRLLNFVIVGGGPTGVEVAGALAELKKSVLPNDFPEIDSQLMSITIVESGANVLGVMSDFAQRKSKKQLEEIGVNLMMNTQLVSYDGRDAQLKDSSTTLSASGKIETSALIWTAGVKGNIPAGLKPDLIVKGNRIVVDDFNGVKGVKDVYAIGDVASIEKGAHPMLAPVAMQQGKNLARNLNRKNENEWKPFSYFDKGTMATIGRSRAVADLMFNIHLKGFLAWMSWLFIHLMLLVGFRNRIIVFINWMWNYFSYDRAIMLIVRKYNKKSEP